MDIKQTKLLAIQFLYVVMYIATLLHYVLCNVVIAKLIAVLILPWETGLKVSHICGPTNPQSNPDVTHM